MSVKPSTSSTYRIEKRKVENTNEAHNDGHLVLKTFDAGEPTLQKTLKEIQISGYVSTSSGITLSYVKDTFTGKRRKDVGSTVYTELFEIKTNDEPMHLRRY